MHVATPALCSLRFSANEVSQSSRGNCEKLQHTHTHLVICWQAMKPLSVGSGTSCFPVISTIHLADIFINQHNCGFNGFDSEVSFQLLNTDGRLPNALQMPTWHHPSPSEALSRGMGLFKDIKCGGGCWFGQFQYKVHVCCMFTTKAPNSILNFSIWSFTKHSHPQNCMLFILCHSWRFMVF